MTSRKFKIPSSSRRHIKIENFSQFVSATRLKHVQDILSCRKVGLPDIDGILCIAGIDSQFNKGMYEILSYLLFDFFDARKEELEKSGISNEIIEDLMILVCADHVEVYCNPINYHWLLPYVSHWPSLKMHCLAENEYGGEGDDASEEFKIHSLIAMLSGCSVIGFPFSGRGEKIIFDIMALEKWPIIQAYALDDFGGGGFFTLKYETVDVSDDVHQLFDFMDPVSIELLLTEHFPLLSRQWNNMMKSVQITLESSSSVLDHKKVSEPYLSYFNHGLMGHKRSCVGIVPFVVLGSDCEKAMLQKAVAGDNIVLSDLPLKTSGISPMICQVVSPTSPLMCTRTYFFCSEEYSLNKGDNRPESSPEKMELRYMVAIYLSMVKAVLSAVDMFGRTPSIIKSKEECLKTLQESCSHLDSPQLMEYLTKSTNMDFVIDTLACIKRKETLQENKTNTLMKYIQLALYNIPVPGPNDNDRPPVSLMFAETFLDSRIWTEGPSNDVSFDYLVLTSTVPRHQLWSIFGHVKKPDLEVISMPGDQWGEILLTQGDVYMTGTWKTALLPPEKISLSVWKHGLLVQSSDYGSFSIHGSEVNRISFYDGNSMSQVAILVMKIKLTEMVKNVFPPHLYVECTDSEECQITFTFVPHSKAYTQLYGNILTAWKKGSQFPIVERPDLLDTQLESL